MRLNMKNHLSVFGSLGCLKSLLLDSQHGFRIRFHDAKTLTFLGSRISSLEYDVSTNDLLGGPLMGGLDACSSA